MRRPFEETHPTWYSVSESVVQRAERKAEKQLEKSRLLHMKRRAEAPKEVVLGLRGGAPPPPPPVPVAAVSGAAEPSEPPVAGPSTGSSGSVLGLGHPVVKVPTTDNPPDEDNAAVAPALAAHTGLAAAGELDVIVPVPGPGPSQQNEPPPQPIPSIFGPYSPSQAPYQQNTAYVQHIPHAGPSNYQQPPQQHGKSAGPSHQQQFSPQQHPVAGPSQQNQQASGSNTRPKKYPPPPRVDDESPQEQYPPQPHRQYAPHPQQHYPYQPQQQYPPHLQQQYPPQAQQYHPSAGYFPPQPPQNDWRYQSPPLGMAGPAYGPGSHEGGYNYDHQNRGPYATHGYSPNDQYDVEGANAHVSNNPTILRPGRRRASLPPIPSPIPEGGANPDAPLQQPAGAIPLGDIPAPANPEIPANPADQPNQPNQPAANMPNQPAAQQVLNPNAAPPVVQAPPANQPPPVAQAEERLGLWRRILKALRSLFRAGQKPS